ncbi:MAG: RDD family protein [Streptosporangiaceae bacterium]|nr:RDD family protein [Streptosporangiaceae bacterium]MBV9855752.1 RDD family protein [Streptosporangiaceae bacterium]
MSDTSLAHSQSADGLAPRAARPLLRVSAMPSEARPYQGHRAGIVSRMLASAADFVIVAAVLAAGYGAWSLVLFLLRPARFRFPVVPSGWVLFAGGVVLFAYLSAEWTALGRTWGDVLFGLRVVNRRGERLHPAGAVLRAAICVLFPIGILWVAVSRANRSVADVILRTSVIYDWGPTVVSAGRGEPGRTTQRKPM